MYSKKHTLYCLNPLQFIKACFTGQKMVCVGEYSVCIWTECAFCCCWVVCFYKCYLGQVGWSCIVYLLCPYWFSFFFYELLSEWCWICLICCGFVCFSFFFLSVLLHIFWNPLMCDVYILLYSLAIFSWCIDPVIIIKPSLSLLCRLLSDICITTPAF